MKIDRTLFVKYCKEKTMPKLRSINNSPNYRETGFNRNILYKKNYIKHSADNYYTLARHIMIYFGTPVSDIL